MKKLLLPLLCIVCFNTFLAAQEATDTTLAEIPDSILAQIIAHQDSITNSFTYQTGKIELEGGLAVINVPEGYKFLDAKQSNYVLTDLWGNPPSETMGMLFPEDISPVSENFTYAIDVSYSDEGYIEDDDAKDLDYGDLLEEMQGDVKAGNEQRTELGYPTVDLVGWAAPPFYDETNKKLHWAKEIAFEGEIVNTLNYNIRVLGRSGYLNLNAIGEMSILPQVQNDIDNILNSVDFNPGHQYADFNPSMDKVAAYGIGGLIAGKVLAKAGFFVFLLKFWKIIAVGVVAFFAFIKRIFTGGDAKAGQ
ncbi:MAG: DUF2167 domain-containing protein [Chitinophagales bacterium]